MAITSSNPDSTSNVGKVADAQGDNRSLQALIKKHCANEFDEGTAEKNALLGGFDHPFNNDTEWNTISEKFQLARSFSFFRTIDEGDVHTIDEGDVHIPVNQIGVLRRFTNMLSSANDDICVT